MLKMLGAALVLAAGAGVGWQLAAALARRPQELRELQGGLALLGTEIRYAATPLALALKRASAAGPAAEQVFGAAARHLPLADGTAAALEAAVRELLVGSSLRPGDVDPLLALAPVLGASDRVDQCRHLALAAERLSVLEAEAQEARRRYTGMYRYLGLLGGAAVALLLS